MISLSSTIVPKCIVCDFTFLRFLLKIVFITFIESFPEIRMRAIALVPPPVANAQIVSSCINLFIVQKYSKSFVYTHIVVILHIKNLNR